MLHVTNSSHGLKPHEAQHYGTSKFIRTTANALKNGIRVRLNTTETYLYKLYSNLSGAFKVRLFYTLRFFTKSVKNLQVSTHGTLKLIYR